MSRGTSTSVLSRLIVLAFPLLVIGFFGVNGIQNLPGSAPEDVRTNFAPRDDPGRSLIGGKELESYDAFSSLVRPENTETRARVPVLKVRKLADAEGFIQSLDPQVRSGLNQKDRMDLSAYLSHLNSSPNREPSWLCWDHDVSTAKLAAYHEIDKLIGLVGSEYRVSANQFQSNGRWSKTASDGFDFSSQGDASTVTWSIVPDGTLTPGLNNQSGTGSNLRAWMASIYGGSASGPAVDQPWFDIFESAFEAMAETCGVTLIYEPMDDGIVLDSSNAGVLGIRGDIRIAARGLDGNSGNLAIAFPPDDGDMILDSSDGTFLITSGNSIRLFNTITHELGHSLGLAHVCPINRTKLLEPSLTTTFRGPQFDEFQSLQRLYGDRFEVHGSFRDNDTPLSAKVIDLVEGEAISFSRLSIDDDRDRDFYRFEGLVGQRLNVHVIPGEGIYFEGGEAVDSCSQGIEFDSASIHDLAIQVLGEDGETILFEADSGTSGEAESIQMFELPATGVFYLRVDGDLANATQVYELRAELLARLPAARLHLVEHLVLEESGSVKNGRLDPGETIRLAIEIENVGELPTGLLTTEILGSENAVVFSESAPSQLNPGESALIEMVVGTSGTCGDFMQIDLQIEDSSGELLTEVLNLEAGVVTKPVAFVVDFEELNELPAGWASDFSDSGDDWTVAASRSDSRFQSAYTPARDSIGEAFLMSSVFELAPGGGTLSFSHLYRLEPGFDGGVLEVSRNGAEWSDLISHPDVIATGGYNRGIREGFGSAIAGQQAWSGLQEISTQVTAVLPEAWAGEVIQFRWRVVHDASSAREGWWIDEVKMEMLIEDCEPHRPEISLALASGELSENHPDLPAILELKTNLPLVSSLSIPLEISGTAGLSNDYQFDPEAVLVSGQTSLEVPLTVISDSVTEGDESVLIEVPPESANFVAGSNSSVQLNIRDLMNVETWTLAFFGSPVDLFGDFDGDGFDELSEYLLGTNPVLSSDQPSLALVPNDGKFLLPLAALPVRPDASLGVEFSSDLRSWETGEFVSGPEGLEIAPMTQKSYFRLTFSLD